MLISGTYYSSKKSCQRTSQTPLCALPSLLASYNIFFTARSHININLPSPSKKQGPFHPETFPLVSSFPPHLISHTFFSPPFPCPYPSKSKTTTPHHTTPITEKKLEKNPNTPPQKYILYYPQRKRIKSLCWVGR